MKNKKAINQHEAKSQLSGLFNKVVIESNFEMSEFHEAAEEFAEKSFDFFYEQTFPENLHHSSGVMYRIIPQFNWAIHDSELKLWKAFLISLIPVSGVVFAGASIPVSAITVGVTLFLQRIQPLINKGVRLSNDQITVLLSLNFLSKKNNNKVSITDLVEVLNNKRIIESKETWEEKDVIEILIFLQSIVHKDGTVSKFVDTLDEKRWWSVDV